MKHLLKVVAWVALACPLVASIASAQPPASGAPPAWGRLLITLPNHPLPQIVNLDRLAPLADHPDGNARGSRHDGRNGHYFKIQNIGFKQDTLTVFSAATGQLEYTARELPRISEADPSPQAASVFSFVFLDIASDKGLFAVVDLANQQRVLASDKGEVGKYLHWWMPDGSLRRMHAHTGELSAWRGSLQSTNERIDWQPLGAVPPPLPGALFGAAAVSPDGDALLLSTVEARTHRVDLWMLDLRGGALQRVTNDGFVSFVRWSPDGRHLLLKRSNVSHIGSTVQGQCSYWLAPRDARQVSGVVPGQPHAALRQVFYDAGRQVPASLPCGEVSAWLR